MVNRTYCDECGKELKAGEDVVNNNIHFIAKSGAEFHVIVNCYSGVIKTGNLCFACVKKRIVNAELKPAEVTFIPPAIPPNLIEPYPFYPLKSKKKKHHRQPFNPFYPKPHKKYL